MGRRNPERRVHKGNSDARIDREVMLGRKSNGTRSCKWLFFHDSNRRYPPEVLRTIRRLRGVGRPPKVELALTERTLTSMLADLFG